MTARMRLSFTTLILSLGLAACGLHVDRPTTIERDAFPVSEKSVGGAITVAAGAKGGNLSSVTGDIKVGQGGVASSAQTVTGSIRLASDSRVLRTVRTTTGAIVAEKGAEVAGGISTLTGDIDLAGAKVKGGLRSTSGTITLRGDTIIEGGITLDDVQVDEKSPDVLRFPRILIGPHARIEGPIISKRGAVVIASVNAHVGPIEGAHASLVTIDPTQ